jgi:hypothetical protein
LSSSEIKYIWEVLGKSEIGRVILLILVTAHRPGEISGMAWNKIVVGGGNGRRRILDQVADEHI